MFVKGKRSVFPLEGFPAGLVEGVLEEGVSDFLLPLHVLVVSHSGANGAAHHEEHSPGGNSHGQTHGVHVGVHAAAEDLLDCQEVLSEDFAVETCQQAVSGVGETLDGNEVVLDGGENGAHGVEGSEDSTGRSANDAVFGPQSPLHNVGCSGSCCSGTQLGVPDNIVVFPDIGHGCFECTAAAVSIIDDGAQGGLSGDNGLEFGGVHAPTANVASVVDEVSATIGAGDVVSLVG